MADASHRRLGRHRRDPPPVDAGGRQDPPGPLAVAQPLVERAALRVDPGTPDVADPLRRRDGGARARPPRRPAHGAHHGGPARNRGAPPPLGGRLPRRGPGDDGRSRHAGHHQPHAVGDPGRDPLRRRHRPPRVRRRPRPCAVAGAAPGRAGDDLLPGRLQGQGQPRALLLGQLRPGHDPLLGPDRPAASRRHPELPRRRGPRGVLARGHERRVLAGQPRVARPHLLQLRLPHPGGFSAASVEPDEAFWLDALGEFALPYSALLDADDPDATLLSFFASTHGAAAELAGWDRAELECTHPEGPTWWHDRPHADR